MLYLIIGLFSMFIIFVCFNFVTKNDEKFYLKEVFEIFNNITMPTLLFTSLALTFYAFLLFGVGFGISIADYESSISNTYELKQMSEKQYFKRVDSTVTLLTINNDGILSKETFDEDTDNIDYQLTDGKALLTIQKETKIEASTFEKVFFLKGMFDKKEKINSVIIKIPKDSNIEI